MQIAYLALMYAVSLLMAGLFYLIHIPLPWILGPLTAIFLLNSWWKVPLQQSKWILRISFLLTGAQIGTTFTDETLGKVLPYFFPFLIMTIIIIFVCIQSGKWLAVHGNIGHATGVLGSVPGGLSVMLEMSDSMKANTGMVAIFHTIRLMGVLLLVPLLATFLFSFSNETFIIEETTTSLNGWSIVLLFVLFGIAYLFRFKMPAPFVLIPMLVIAVLRIASVPVSDIPIGLYHFAQLSIGIHLGLSITVADLKKVGRLSFVFFLFSAGIILLAVVFGYILSHWSNLTFATAMLSLAPGGLVEMAITAHEVDADPAIVGSLQLIRMLIISLLLPFILRRMIRTDS
ncbi:AbrB family transcriptional regulator [Gracilibacillus alcaliphilus]|uniref:AbrB family transcriptional regulator n=1 Tax=Gracilibacillus alcaliphilus TaxID=1401441 RepID=UPI001EF96E80|nr:AbrB family transcriptional regulator [Gracilibacillus alcaliphilus]MBM7675262.1 membrane AbrB-like protein [Gracilibacillus alcaliphilus]